jgi:hypothetical protein
MCEGPTDNLTVSDLLTGVCGPVSRIGERMMRCSNPWKGIPGGPQQPICIVAQRVTPDSNRDDGNHGQIDDMQPRRLAAMRRTTAMIEHYAATRGSPIPWPRTQECKTPPVDGLEGWCSCSFARATRS